MLKFEIFNLFSYICIMEFKITKEVNKKVSKFYWNYKSNGRIFLSSSDHIEIVEKMIEELNSFEYDYMPNDIFGVNLPGEKWKDISLKYYDNFDLSNIGEDLIKRCEEKGIPIKIVSGHSLPEGGYTESLKEIYGWDCEFYWS